MIDKEALQLLLYAQKFYPKEYANFIHQLEVNVIPMDFENDRFLGLLDGFKAQFRFYLSQLEAPIDQTIIEKNVPTKEVLEPLMQEIQAAQSSQEKHTPFDSNGIKVDRYIKQIKQERSTREIEQKAEPTPTQVVLTDLAPKLVEAASFFSDKTELPTNTLGFPEIPKGFFKAVAETPLQKIISSVVDALPQSAQQNIIQNAIGKAHKVIQDRTDKLGSSIAEYGEVKRALTQMNAGSFQQPGVRLTPNNALFNFFSDAYTSVFVGPQLIAIRYAVYRSWPVQSSWSQMSAVALELRGITMRSLTQKAASEIGKGLVKTSVGTKIGTILGSTFGPVGTAVGGFIGGTLLNKLWGGASGLLNLLSFRGLSRLMTGGVEETPLLKQEGMLAITIGGLALLLTIILPFTPLFTSATDVQYKDENAMIQGLGSVGGPGGPTFDCLGVDKDKPECDLTACDPTISTTGCLWPASGSISQGPSTDACGGTHRGNPKAIDIAAADYSTVVSTVNGTVVSAVTDRPANTMTQDPGCNSTANYIIIRGDNGVIVKFWHLAPVTLVSVDTHVIIGQPIGKTDRTGCGTGSHLHYECAGTCSNINDILPISVPPCVNGTGNSNCTCSQSAGG